MAIGRILAALGSGRVDSRHAGLYLYGLQLATQVAARRPDPLPQEMVRATTCDGGGNAIGAQEHATPTLTAPPAPPKTGAMSCHSKCAASGGSHREHAPKARRLGGPKSCEKVADHEITIEEVFARHREKKARLPSLDALGTENPRALP